MILEWKKYLFITSAKEVMWYRCLFVCMSVCLSIAASREYYWTDIRENLPHMYLWTRNYCINDRSHPHPDFNPGIILMPMTHLPETRASNPALETRKCDMLSSAVFSSCGNLARYSAMLYSTLESGVNGALWLVSFVDLSIEKGARSFVGKLKEISSVFIVCHVFSLETSAGN